eukprot:TRINITY_DN9434_c0_g1_i1.p1 TRINITY_DN9434_c0_g1~~TRINITY_DN9434_c0_g1_i1.p1  ORF type:complete len:64 (+),score=3.02 TRINITY_DN9434_c0_g1_i1:189-380(+)
MPKEIYKQIPNNREKKVCVTVNHIPYVIENVSSLKYVLFCVDGACVYENVTACIFIYCFVYLY